MFKENYIELQLLYKDCKTYSYGIHKTFYRITLSLFIEELQLSLYWWTRPSNVAIAFKPQLQPFCSRRLYLRRESYGNIERSLRPIQRE